VCRRRAQAAEAAGERKEDSKSAAQRRRRARSARGAQKAYRREIVKSGETQKRSARKRGNEVCRAQCSRKATHRWLSSSANARKPRREGQLTISA